MAQRKYLDWFRKFYCEFRSIIFISLIIFLGTLLLTNNNSIFNIPVHAQITGCPTTGATVGGSQPLIRANTTSGNMPVICVDNNGNIFLPNGSINNISAPGGINGQVQFNNNGVLGGNSQFTYNGSGSVTLLHSLEVSGGTTSTDHIGIHVTGAVFPGTGGLRFEQWAPSATWTKVSWRNQTNTGDISLGPETSDTLIWTGNGGFNTPSLTVGTGTLLTKYSRFSVSLSPVAVAANTCAAQSFTVTGIVATDILIGINKPTEQAGLSVTPGHVSAINTLTLNFCNNTGIAITPTPAESYNFVVVQ